MSSRGTPSTSAAIWPSTVSAPVPRSVAPTSMLNEPSSLSLIEQPPMSRKGMAVPCMQKANPIPRRMFAPPGPRSAGATHSGSSRRCQPISRMAWATHSSIPDDMTLGYSSSSPSTTARSPRWGAMSSSSSDLDPVLPLELDDVHAELAGHVLQVGLEGELGLGGAVAPIGPGDRDVGVDDVAVEPLVRASCRR